MPTFDEAAEAFEDLDHLLSNRDKMTKSASKLLTVIGELFAQTTKRRRRLFEQALFFGNGEDSTAQANQLHGRLEYAFSLLSGMQQGGSSAYRRADDEAIDDVVRDVAAALGVNIKIEPRRSLTEEMDNEVFVEKIEEAAQEKRLARLRDHLNGQLDGAYAKGYYQEGACGVRRDEWPDHRERALKSFDIFIEGMFDSVRPMTSGHDALQRSESMNKKQTEPSIVEEISVPINQAMMRMQIDPERVNEIIAAAVLSSGIGDRVKKAAEEWISNPSGNTYNDPIKRAVEEEMKKILSELCHEDSIRTRLKAKIEEELLKGSLADTFLESLVSKIQGIRF